MMPHLVQRPLLKGQARSDVHAHGFALHGHFEAAVSHRRDLVELIDREEVFDPVAEVLRDVAAVLSECLCRVG